MEPNQMGAAGPTPYDFAPTPTPTPSPTNPAAQSMQPAQSMAEPMPAAEPVAPAPEAMSMTMEQQMTAAMQEQVPMSEPMANPEPMTVEAPKKSHGMLIGMILAIVVAVCGIGFGVFMMLSNQQTEDKYKKQISTLQSSNANLQEQLASVEALNGDEALELLSAASPSLPVIYANIYAKYDGEDDIIAYWVKYLDSAFVTHDIIFTATDDGTWSFTLPGETPEALQAIADDYVLLYGGTAPVAPAPSQPVEQPEEAPSEEE